MKKEKKISKFKTSNALDIVHDIELNEELFPLDNCFFHDDPIHLCVENECMRCDYERYLKTVSKEDFANFDFIEGWEWPDIWERRKSA